MTDALRKLRGGRLNLNAFLTLRLNLNFERVGRRPEKLLFLLGDFNSDVEIINFRAGRGLFFLKGGKLLFGQRGGL